MHPNVPQMHRNSSQSRPYMSFVFSHGYAFDAFDASTTRPDDVNIPGRRNSMGGSMNNSMGNAMGNSMNNSMNGMSTP